MSIRVHHCVAAWFVGLAIMPVLCAVAEPASLKPHGQEAQYLSNIRQLTSQEMGLTNAGEAYFAPDEQMVIFQATPVGKKHYQIYTLDLKTNALKMVSTGKGACTCAFFHPSGKKIIFASSHLAPKDKKPEPKSDDGYKWEFDEYMDIFEANPDGTSLRQLTDAPGYDAEGSYSSDGKQIVFTSERDGDLELYVMNADGTNQTRITSGKGYDGGAFFSPDGKTLLYRGDRRSDGEMNLQLRQVNPDGTSDRAITDNPIFNWCPYWHPSGRYFIFTQVDHGAYARGERPNYDLFLTILAGKRFERITFDAAFDGLPVFNGDGSKLMWTSKRGGLDDSQVFIADFKVPKVIRK